ncbi:MAG: GNAT family N-acetyltransferase [Acidiferrobacterales bacterium]
MKNLFEFKRGDSLYTFALERGDKNYEELEPLYRQHYSEMRKRLKKDGVNISDYNPNLREYFKAFSGGWLLNFVIRLNSKPVGYSNVYITNDMHNSDLIAQEDTIYVHPDHRNGVGRKLVKTILHELERRGVVRASMTAITDTRATNLWRRLGFRAVATQMIYVF